MNKKKIEKVCDHFWEIQFPITKANKQKYVCIHCGEPKKMSIPILNIDKIMKDING